MDGARSLLKHVELYCTYTSYENYMYHMHLLCTVNPFAAAAYLLVRLAYHSESTAVAVSSSTGKTPHTTHHTPPQHTTHKHTHSNNNAEVEGVCAKIAGLCENCGGLLWTAKVVNGPPWRRTYFFMDIRYLLLLIFWKSWCCWGRKNHVWSLTLTLLWYHEPLSWR